jgi:acyl-CoA thioesterase-2
MSSSLVERLAVVAISADGFVSRTPPEARHVFGGLLIGQALRAAALTVADGQVSSSLHASFVAAGTGGEPLRYEVERTRDGSSFATRRVVASQERGVVFLLTAAFHHEEDGPAYQAPAASDVPGPDDLPVGRYDSPWFESRDVPAGDDMVRRAWFRPTSPLPDDPDLHLQALAYLSDHGPTRAAREPHGHLADDARRQSVSLDHSIWFHRPADVNGWLLSELAPVATGRGRGLAAGTIRTRTGDLLATVAQEVLLRQR